jgi:hypothetical protein
MKDKINLPVEHYLQKIDNNEVFSFIRIGDGEALCVFPLHWLKVNCDGSAFLPEIKEPMKDIFRNQFDYYHCLLDCSFDLNGDLFRTFLEETCPDMDFYNGEVFQEMIAEGRIEELITKVSTNHNPVFVGGSHFQNIHLLNGFVNSPIHLQVPNKDSFKEITNIINEISELIAQGHRMFLFSAGYTTKVIIDTLFPYVGEDVFMIDMGSLFDPFVGILSRDGQKYRGFEFYQPHTKLKLL